MPLPTPWGSLVDDSDARLEALIDQVLAGELSREAAFERYPRLAARLDQDLQAAGALRAAQDLGLAPPARAQLRARLTAHTLAHPRQSTRHPQPGWRWALAGLALALVAFTGTTAYAQTALPGQALYPLKIASEKAWVELAPDNGTVRLSLLQRRADELLAVHGDPLLFEQAQSAYADAAQAALRHHRRMSTIQVVQAVEAQQVRLRRAGIESPLPVGFPTGPSDLSQPGPSSSPSTETASPTGTAATSQDSGERGGASAGAGGTPTSGAGTQPAGVEPGPTRNGPGQASRTPRPGP